MDEHPSCLRVIPCEDNIIYFYVFSENKGILESLECAAKETFPDSEFKFIDLLHPRMEKLLIRLPKERKTKGEELSKLAREIEQNLSLFENRLNITAVEPAYKVVDFQEEDEACVRIYVLGKGKIPSNETEFSELKKLDGYSYDVVEGFCLPSCSFTSTSFPLRGGVSIGVEGKDDTGTLGAFVTDGEDKHYILSCEHVLNPESSNEDVSSVCLSTVQPSEADVNPESSEEDSSSVVGRSVVQPSETDVNPISLDEDTSPVVGRLIVQPSESDVNACTERVKEKIQECRQKIEKLKGKCIAFSDDEYKVQRINKLIHQEENK